MKLKKSQSITADGKTILGLFSEEGLPMGHRIIQYLTNNLNNKVKLTVSKVK